MIRTRKIVKRSSIAWAALLLACVTCTFDGDTASTLTIDPLRSDAGPFQDSGANIDGGRDTTPRTHLLLTEIKTTVQGTEFIEIYNPSALVITLSNYYLSDNAAYVLLPTAQGPGPKPSIINSDFIARFPEVATINPGQVLIVGINADALGASLGVDADFRIGKTGSGVDMRAAYPSSIGAQSGITDSGEGIALFYWDGLSDLVVDVDLVNAGDMISESNQLANKSGLSIDGPDADNMTSSYKDDLATMGFFLSRTVGNQSYARTALEMGHEQQTGGNGRLGHDETSEDIGATWVIIEQATPGQVPTSL